MRRRLDDTLPESNKPRVVIIGGGFAGINLAKRLDSALFQIVLLDKNNHHVFQLLLYQMATAGLEPEACCSPVRKILERKKDFHFRMVNVERIDTDEQFVLTDSGALVFDFLVIATGAATHFFGNADFERYTLPLKDIGDALTLRNHLFEVLEAATKVNVFNQVLIDPPERHHENVFAIGEVSSFRSEEWPDGLPGMAPLAIQQGQHLATNLKRLQSHRAPRPFKYTDKGTMATIGRNCAVAELKRGYVLTGFLGWVTWMVVRLRYLIGSRNNIIVSVDWVWNYFTYDRGVRAIIHPSIFKRR